MNLERLILAEILLAEYEEQFEAFTQCGEKYFTQERYKLMFNAFGKILLRKIPLDNMAAYSECKISIEGFKIEEITELALIANTSAKLMQHVMQLKEIHYKNQVLETIKESEKEIETATNADDVNGTKESLIIKLSGMDIDTSNDFVDFGEQTKIIDKHISHERRIEGYSWGISELDTITSGIIVPRLIVIGGLKKSGKTRFVIQARQHLMNQGIYAPFQSMEMPAYELTKLTYSCYTKIDDMKFRSKSFISNEEKRLYEDAKKDIKFDYLPTECKSGLSVEQIIGRVRKYSKLYPNCVIFIDYLQRIKHDRNKQATELESISNSLADATRFYNVSIILLSQLSNLAEREIPTTGHLKGCVEENTLIDGKLIKEYYFENLKKDISSFNTETKTHEKRKPSDIIDSGVKNCYEITTKSGKKIIVSGTTKLYTNKEEWQDVADIKVGDKIVVASD